MSSMILPSAIPSLNVGGRLITDLSNLVTVVGLVSNTNNHCTLRAGQGPGGYVVPTGKTLRIVAGALASYASGVACALAIWSCDNDIGFTSSSIGTNATGPGGYTGNPAVIVQIGGVNYAAGPMDLYVPATKLIGATGNFSGASNAGILLWGYLQ